MLKSLGDEFFNGSLNLGDLFKCLDIRNLSYIEHGINTVDDKKFETMKNMTDNCILRLCEINRWVFNYDDFEFADIARY